MTLEQKLDGVLARAAAADQGHDQFMAGTGHLSDVLPGDAEAMIARDDAHGAAVADVPRLVAALRAAALVPGAREAIEAELD